MPEGGSPLMRALSRSVDLMLLNILTILTCLPVFTAGASFTALHCVLRRLLRDEEGHIAPQFFRYFRENLRTSTAVWLMLLLPLAVGVADIFLILSGMVRMPATYLRAIAAGMLFLISICLYAFPLLAAFNDSAFGTVKNAVRLVFGAFPRTVLMLLIALALPAVCCVVPAAIPLLLLFGISFPALLCAKLYTPVFERLRGEK